MFQLAAYPKTYEQYRGWSNLPSSFDSNEKFLKFFSDAGYSIPSDPRDETAYYQLTYQGQMLADGHFDRNKSLDETDQMILAVFANHYEKS